MWKKSPAPEKTLKDEMWKWPHEPLMNWFGWWAEEINRPKLRKAMQIVRAVLIPTHVVFYSGLIMNTINEYNTGTVTSTVKSAFVSGPSTVACFKLFVTVWHRKSLKEITNSLDTMMNGILTRKIHPDCEKEVRNRWRSCRKLYKTCVYFGLSVTTQAFLAPLFQTLSTAATSTEPLPFDSWLVYLGWYFYWALNTACIGHVLYMFDATYFAMADNLQIHFVVLMSYLENLDLTKSDEVDLKLCAKNHIELLRLCRIFRRATKPAIQATRLCSMLLLCAGTFVLTSAGSQFTENERSNLFLTLVYIAAVFFNYCRCADNIAKQCDDITTYCYNSQWVAASESQKKSLFNMMTISRMEPKFCGIAGIDLDTFVNVMRGVYSYYNFLTAVDVTEPTPGPTAAEKTEEIME